MNITFEEFKNITKEVDVSATLTPYQGYKVTHYYKGIVEVAKEVSYLKCTDNGHQEWQSKFYKGE